MSPARTFWRSRRGNAATEFAFIMPILLLFMGGVVEFGRLFQAYNVVNRLATRYAITYADCYDTPSGSCDSNTGHELASLASASAIKNMAPQLNPSPSPRIFEIVMSNATPATPTVIYSSVAGGLTASETAKAQIAIGPGQYGVVVTISYQHTLLFFSSLMSQFIPPSVLAVSYTVAQRKN